MVGTVYRSPEPGAPPFVEVGHEVGADSTVCIVEAMKVFTAVAAGVAGVVEEVHVDTGDFVEFDQPLLRIAPTPTNGV
jgi:acetyl-CoA carboxylase biotin carboxyl carrier protein